MKYEPQPIDTSRVKLPPNVKELTELLARNSHDIWAAQRFADGWTYGPHRDDHAKQHPSLVPYDELSERERTYDRQTAMGALKAIIALGFRIEKVE